MRIHQVLLTGVYHHANNYGLFNGSFKADGDSGQGGKIDFSGKNIRLTKADISAKGSSQGGKVRVGGEYLGGKKLKLVGKKEYNGFINRLIMRMTSSTLKIRSLITTLTSMFLVYLVKEERLSSGQINH